MTCVYQQESNPNKQISRTEPTILLSSLPITAMAIYFQEISQLASSELL
jgi:hypothetical protein